MKRLLLLLPAAVLLASCGETNQEVTARHQPAIDALRADMGQLAALVQAGPADTAPAAPLDPPPVFKENDAAGSNTTILILERLIEPERNFPGGELHLPGVPFAHLLDESVAETRLGNYDLQSR